MSKYGSKSTVASSKPSTRRLSAANNPFESDSDSETQVKPVKSQHHTHDKSNPRDQLLSHAGDHKQASSTSHDHSRLSSARNVYKNDFRDDGGFENQSVQELESYAAHKAEETTEKLNGCVRIAEDIRDDASRTLVLLHQQGEQITRTHTNATYVEHDLSRVNFTLEL